MNGKYCHWYDDLAESVGFCFYEQEAMNIAVFTTCVKTATGLWKF